MTYLGQFTKERLESMKETAYHMALAFRGKEEIVGDIMAIALVEINRELDERKLNAIDIDRKYEQKTEWTGKGWVERNPKRGLANETKQGG